MAEKYGFSVEYKEDELYNIFRNICKYYGFKEYDSATLVKFLVMKEHHRLIRKEIESYRHV